MSEKRYIDLVRPLVDGEDVLAAGVFQPRGTSGGMAGSAGLGGKGIGLAIGAAGMIEAGHVAAAVEHEPRWTILAVTPTRVLAFEGRADGVHWAPGACYATFDRETLAVTVHGRVNVRVLVLEDTTSGRHLELETNRIGPEHGVVVIHLLADAVSQTAS